VKPGETRWRIQVTFPSNGARILTKHRTGSCKLCICAVADAWAQSLEATVGDLYGEPKWTVEKMYGHLRGWEIVVHSGMIKGDLLKRHAH
jgi:hypothetical protein